jgi:hypothetical protein
MKKMKSEQAVLPNSCLEEEEEEEITKRGMKFPIAFVPVMIVIFSLL